MADFTIIIPHRGNPLGLWATIHSCEEDLSRTSFNYNYIVVSNGEELSVETKNTIHYLEKTGRLLKHHHSDEPLSPPAAREIGAAAADGRLLFFFDNHCLVTPQYFSRAVLDFENPDIAVLHSTTRFYSGDNTHYHYRLRLGFNFWADSATFPQNSYKPYRIAAGGHGGFVVRKSVWESLGGYGPSTLLNGYGGEELLFDLKAGRYGHAVFLDPKLIHYHYTGDRGYSRHYTDEYYVNMMVSAHVIGGESWLFKVYESFSTGGHLRLHSKQNMYDLLVTAFERSAAYAKEVQEKSMFTLDELLTQFRATSVAM